MGQVRVENTGQVVAADVRKVSHWMDRAGTVGHGPSFSRRGSLDRAAFGAYPSQAFAGGRGASIANAVGNIAAGLKLTHANSARLTTSATYTVLGGIGIRDAKSVSTRPARTAAPREPPSRSPYP